MSQSCPITGQSFEVSAQDLEFYRRISPKIGNNTISLPPPTLAPDARLIPRMTWRNDRTFFKRCCDLSGQQMIAIYPEGTPFPVYHPTHWWGDRWDAMSYGRHLNLAESFFEQWHQLMLTVPRLGVDIVNCENCDYCNYCGDDKNCYLDIAGEANEDCFYNLFTKYSKNCVDCTFVYESQLMYESINCYSCHDVRYGYYLENCSNCEFCFDLKDCQHCLFCSNLRHTSYHIFNRACSKDEYNAALSALKMQSYDALQTQLTKWKEIIRDAIHRDVQSSNAEDCTGDNIKNCKNCEIVFNVTNCWDCKYLYDVLDARDCYDLNYSLYEPEASYELISTLSMKYSAFCMASHYCHNSYYCDQCNNSRDLFGCIGLNQKQYCILNKQYSKQDYESLVPQLIDAMRQRGEWGEFFPSALSPWGYNETVAQEYFPIVEKEAHRLGFQWRSAAASTPVEASHPPDSIDSTSDDILSVVLKCRDTGKPYRIVKPELDFYRRMNVSVPRVSPHARHLRRLGMRNPRHLYNRSCSKTGKPITTTYAPNRPEKVYCEEAYLEAIR